MSEAFEESIDLVAQEGANCQITYVSNGQAPATPGIPAARLDAMSEVARRFLEHSGGDVCVLLSGELQSDFRDVKRNTETAVIERLRAVLRSPEGAALTDQESHPGRPDVKIDLVLDTLGGSLDSAFKIVLFLSQFTSDLRVYVPRRAKSAGTLIAIGARELYLGRFAELGPLDTQIPDPRNPTDRVSALDCFQSVDYVRGFGIDTLKRTLVALGKEMRTGIPLSELLETATTFANSCTKAMLDHVSALDFGGWGRTLQIGERYAQILLKRSGYDEAEARAIAYRLVYSYTHHPFVMDAREANDLGLHAQLMTPTLTGLALLLVNACAGLEIAVGAWGRTATAAVVGQDGAPRQQGEEPHAAPGMQPEGPPEPAAARGMPDTPGGGQSLIGDSASSQAIVQTLRELLSEEEQAWSPDLFYG